MHNKNFPAWILAAILCTIGGCVIYIGDSPFPSFHAKYEKTLDLSEAMASGSHLDAVTPCGPIAVNGVDTTTCTVHVTIRTRAASEEEAEELAEQIKVQLLNTANGLKLEAQCPKRKRRQSISIGYDIKVPQQTGLTCKSSSGSLTLENLRGTVHAKTSSGSVHARNLGLGDVTCESSSGSVSLTEARGLGSCDLHTSSGTVKAVQVEARSLYLNSSSGGVTADHVTCEKIVGHTSSGSVRALFTPETPAHLDAELTTSSGSVNVTLPPIFGGTIDIGTSSGSTDVDRPVTVRGKIDKKHLKGSIGEGTGRLVAKTSSGSVTVR